MTVDIRTMARKLRRPLRLAGLIAALALPSAAAQAACRFDARVVVHGPTKEALPAGSILELTIYDANLADAPLSASAVGTIRRRVEGRRFPIEVPVRVRSARRCPVGPAVAIRIERNKRLLYINDTQTPIAPNKRVTATLIQP